MTNSILERLEDEMVKATRKYGPFTSSHEDYGVLMEEVQELLDAIQRNEGADVCKEAIQVAAVACRLAIVCDDKAFQRRSRFVAPNVGPE